MTRTEYIVNGVLIRYTHTPPFSPQVAAERAALSAEIVRDKENLETLRKKEIELRDELVGELRHLKFNVEVAAHRIETRQWADGCAALDTDFEHVLEAQDALMECVDDIAHTESMIADQQGDLEDSALWQEEKY